MKECENGVQLCVPWDFIDEAMGLALLSSYQGLTEDVRRLKKIKKLQDWQQEDLEQFETILAALDIIGPYYVYDFKKKVKKHAKR